MSTKTKPTTASKFYEDVIDLACNLYSRWLDEGQYEDEADYLASFQKVASKYGLIVHALKKRPWGFTFSDSNGDELKVYQLTVTTRQVAYKRIK